MDTSICIHSKQVWENAIPKDFFPLKRTFNSEIQAILNRLPKCTSLSYFTKMIKFSQKHWESSLLNDIKK